MRRYLTLIVILFSLCPGPIYGGQTPSKIRVLILDERFPLEPSEGEMIKRIGRMQGQLLLGGISYRGQIEVYRGERGLYIINELPLEDYVASVVASEVADSWSIEALKAQAVVVRTYAVRHIQKAADALYHLTSSTLHQIYLGDSQMPSVAEAVGQTKGEILTYEGEPIEALYHSTCGGRTENSGEVFSFSYPYLKSVPNNCSISPYWRWKRVLSRHLVEDLLRVEGIGQIKVLTRTSTGRAAQMLIVTESGDIRMPARDLRRLLGWKRLPSTWFDVEQKGKKFIFKGRGYGHGVGLCQWGAQQMALEGKTYSQILQYYYPGTTIEKLQ